MCRRSAWRGISRGCPPLVRCPFGADRRHVGAACSSIYPGCRRQSSTVRHMPPRSIANATISFGLVSVPVNLYSSSESKTSVSFNMLHKKCGGRLKQQYICPKDDNVVVGRDETVKGYAFSKDQYVVFSTEEIKAVEEKATNMIDVIEFIPLAQVQREYVDKVYYLGPDKGGERAYRLLCEALMQTGRAALGQYAARGKQNLI